MVTIKINKELCIGCGACESLCPDCFEMKDGKAHAKQCKNVKCAKEAADSCPVSAISVK